MKHGRSCGLALALAMAWLLCGCCREGARPPIEIPKIDRSCAANVPWPGVPPDVWLQCGIGAFETCLSLDGALELNEWIEDVTAYHETVERLCGAAPPPEGETL